MTKLIFVTEKTKFYWVEINHFCLGGNSPFDSIIIKHSWYKILKSKFTSKIYNSQVRDVLFYRQGYTQKLIISCRLFESLKYCRSTVFWEILSNNFQDGFFRNVCANKNSTASANYILHIIRFSGVKYFEAEKNVFIAKKKIRKKNMAHF